MGSNRLRSADSTCSSPQSSHKIVEPTKNRMQKGNRRTDTFAPVPKHRKSGRVALLGFCERHYFVKGSVQDVETGSVLEIV